MVVSRARRALEGFKISPAGDAEPAVRLDEEARAVAFVMPLMRSHELLTRRSGREPYRRPKTERIENVAGSRLWGRPHRDPS